MYRTFTISVCLLTDVLLPPSCLFIIYFVQCKCFIFISFNLYFNSHFAGAFSIVPYLFLYFYIVLLSADFVFTYFDNIVSICSCIYIASVFVYVFVVLLHYVYINQPIRLQRIYLFT